MNLEHICGKDCKYPEGCWEKITTPQPSTSWEEINLLNKLIAEQLDRQKSKEWNTIDIIEVAQKYAHEARHSLLAELKKEVESLPGVADPEFENCTNKWAVDRDAVLKLLEQ